MFFFYVEMKKANISGCLQAFIHTFKVFHTSPKHNYCAVSHTHYSLCYKAKNTQFNICLHNILHTSLSLFK